MSRECLLYYLILWPYTIQSMIETVLAFEIVVTSNYILERKTRGDTRINRGISLPPPVWTQKPCPLASRLSLRHIGDEPEMKR